MGRIKKTRREFLRNAGALLAGTLLPLGFSVLTRGESEKEPPAVKNKDDDFLTEEQWTRCYKKSLLAHKYGIKIYCYETPYGIINSLDKIPGMREIKL